MRPSSTVQRCALLCTTLCLMLLLGGIQARGQSDSTQLQLGVGYAVGGTTPLSMPQSIQRVDAFHLSLSPTVWAGAALPIGNHWSLYAGLRAARKTMDVEVTTQGYHMAIVQGDNSIEGYFTGHVRQEVDLWALSLPVQACYNLGQKWSVRMGPYLSAVVKRRFGGVASDGYLRQGTPAGPRITIGDTEETQASYDFSNELNHLQWGIALSADYTPWPHIGINAHVEWGLSSLLHNDFHTVEQTLYPIYATLSLFYRL